MTPRCKIAFIGTHGVGKTTLCYGLAARLKTRDVGVEVVHEVARRSPLPINEETSVAAQSWILHTQIAEELVAMARYTTVICDRSVLDNYTYLLLSAGRQEGLEQLVETWMRSYDLLVHVPVIESFASVPFQAPEVAGTSNDTALPLSCMAASSCSPGWLACAMSTEAVPSARLAMVRTMVIGVPPTSRLPVQRPSRVLLTAVFLTFGGKTASPVR